MSDLVIVWRSPPITHGPFAVLDTVAEPDKTKIAAALLRLETNDPAAYDLLDPLYGGGYAAVDLEDYGSVATLAVTNAEAFTMPPASAR